MYCRQSGCCDNNHDLLYRCHAVMCCYSFHNNNVRPPPTVKMGQTTAASHARRQSLKLTLPLLMTGPQPRARSKFCSIALHHVIASQRILRRPQVQAKARVWGNSPPHTMLWSLDQREPCEGVMELRDSDSASTFSTRSHEVIYMETQTCAISAC